MSITCTVTVVGRCTIQAISSVRQKNVEREKRKNVEGRKYGKKQREKERQITESQYSVTSQGEQNVQTQKYQPSPGCIYICVCVFVVWYQ
jgi:hypothetical protein